MEPTGDPNIEHLRLRLEEERLGLERQKHQQENRFFRRNSPVIIASFVPFIVAAISVAQFESSRFSDRRERLINYVKYIDGKLGDLRTSNDASQHYQIAYMTSTILDSQDRCSILQYISERVAKNRAIRDIYDSEAKQDACAWLLHPMAAQQAGLLATAAADEGAPRIRAIYLYRQRDSSSAAAETAQVGQKLNDMGYNVPGDNVVEKDIAESDIRYFNSNDRSAAVTLQGTLTQATGKPFTVSDYSKKQPSRSGFLEIWIASR
jgi:hypothetical protein